MEALRASVARVPHTHRRNLCVGLIAPMPNVSICQVLFIGNELGGSRRETTPAWISNLPFPSENARPS